MRRKRKMRRRRKRRRRKCWLSVICMVCPAARCVIKIGCLLQLVDGGAAPPPDKERREASVTSQAHP